MTRDLRDYALVRQGELTRILAGCALVEPALVCELALQLRPIDLTDEHARKFILALTPDADPLETARSLGVLHEYSQWMGIACDVLPNLKQTARTTADEIKRLVMVCETLTELETWLAVARAVGRGTYER